MIGADGHDRDIDGDCWLGCPGCARDLLARTENDTTPTRIVVSATEARRIIARFGELNFETWARFHGVEP